MTNPLEYDQPVTLETLQANARFDAEHHSVCMDPGVPLRGRNLTTAVLGPLTDKRIGAYERLGYYSKDFRDARRELMKKKDSRRKGRFGSDRRDGNFLLNSDGSKVYAPL